MLISQTLNKTIKKIKNNQTEAEMLLCFVLKKPKEFLYTHPEYKLNLLQIFYLKHLINKRLKGYSLAVIVGEKEFYGYRFKVNKHILVPRPETEMFIDFITHNLKLITQKKGTIFVDVGTGTGCIPITLNRELKIKNNEQSMKYFAVDISKKALKIAKQNAQLNNIEKEIKFYQGNLLEPIINNIKLNNRPLLITANLPYLTPKQVNSSPSIQKEPKLALIAGNDGLKCYKGLFKQIKLLKSDNIIVLCEIDPNQAKNISKLIKLTLPSFSFKIKKDLRGFKRLVIISN